MLKLLSSIQSHFEIPAVQNRIDYLDGYRGFATVLVILQHYVVVFELHKTDYALFGGAATVGVAQFFMLSSFLLTYRLILGLEVAQSGRVRLLKLLQYAIRRFFRVYMPFVVFWTILYAIPSEWNKYFMSRPAITYTEGLRLNFTESHLSTVPLAIRYYFFIPLISYLVVRLNRCWYFIPFVLAITSHIVEPYTLFTNKTVPFYFVPFFINGSIIAILYHCLKQYKKTVEFIESSNIQRIFSGIALALTFGQIRFNWVFMLSGYEDWQVHLISLIVHTTFALLLFSAPNILTSFYGFSIFKSIGRYSYGMYLWQYVAFGCLRDLRNKFTYKHELLLLVFLIVYVLGSVWSHIVELSFVRIGECICRRLAQFGIFQSKPKIKNHSYYQNL